MRAILAVFCLFLNEWHLPRIGKGFVCTVSVLGGRSRFVSGDITLGQDLTSFALQGRKGPLFEHVLLLFRTLNDPLPGSIQQTLLIPIKVVWQLNCARDSHMFVSSLPIRVGWRGFRFHERSGPIRGLEQRINQFDRAPYFYKMYLVYLLISCSRTQNIYKSTAN